MRLCLRKFHPKRWPVLLAWLAVIIVIVHQLSIITVSVEVHPPQFGRARRLALQNDTTTRGDSAVQDQQDPETRAASGSFREENVKMIRGKFRNTKGYLTIGLCTVPRNGAFYLPNTLLSLTANLTSLQRNTTVIVIYLGSYDEAWVKDVLALLDESYKDEVAGGMIQVIQPNPRIYPEFSNLTRRTYGDSQDRIIWRTKQNIDFAYLFSHARELSEYYIHIEDDVLALKGYLKNIQTFVSKRNKKDSQWFCLEFSRLGFIGKLFHSSDLTMMKDYFLMFQYEKPGDLLLNDLKVTMTQFKDIYSLTSAFKHIGRQSSLTNKTFVIKEDTRKGFFKGFGRSKFKPFGRVFNPPATVRTSLLPYGNHKPEDVYVIASHKMFWAKSANVGDTFEVILEDSATLKAATISTGHPIKKNYKLRGAQLKVGTSLDSSGACMASKTLGTLKDGYLHYTAYTFSQINCLVVYVTKSQSSNVIISKIVLAF